MSGKRGVAAGEELTGLLAAAQADTRMLGLRGHTVREWRQEEDARKQEAEKRRSAAGADRSAGFGMGRMPVKPRRKIYPNEPCPCGSGRKYKKCCAGISKRNQSGCNMDAGRKSCSVLF